MPKFIVVNSDDSVVIEEGENLKGGYRSLANAKTILEIPEGTKVSVLKHRFGSFEDRTIK